MLGKERCEAIVFLYWPQLPNTLQRHQGIFPQLMGAFPKGLQEGSAPWSSQRGAKGGDIYQSGFLLTLVSHWSSFFL